MHLFTFGEVRGLLLVHNAAFGVDFTLRVHLLLYEHTEHVLYPDFPNFRFMANTKRDIRVYN